MNEIIEFFFIGYAGEKNARRKPIDISDLQTRWPEATPILMVNRPKETAPYPATTTVEGSVLYWEVAEIDVAKSGFGQAQVFMRDADGNVLGKSAVMNTLIKASLNGTEQENPPPALETWIAKFLEAYEGLGGGNNSGGSSVSIDTTLTQSGKAADAKVTGDALNELKEANATQDEAIAKKANDADLAAVAKSGSYNDLTNKPDIQTVPTTLPNPNKLILSGAVTAEYDGSTEVSVEIPAGGSGSYTLPIATPTTLGGVKPAAKTDDMTQAVGVDAEGLLFTAPGAGGGSSGSTWDMLINQEVAEDCATVDYYQGDNGEAFSDYDELLILIDIFGNTNGYGTAIKASFSKTQGAWQSPYPLDLYGRGLDKTDFIIRMLMFQKTSHGILPRGQYRQSNTGSMSNGMNMHVGTGNANAPNFTLPISANTHMTLNETQFSKQTEFEAVRIGGYQAVMGAGTIIKVWGRRA